jgi:hypothetical protein
MNTNASLEVAQVPKTSNFPKKSDYKPHIEEWQ